MEDKQQVVFATYKDNKLIGYRADTMGTLSLKYPKIYTYSESQVKTVLDNVKSECNYSGSKFLKQLFGMSTNVMTISSEPVNTETVLDRVAKQEEDLRALGEFEVRVIPFNTPIEEWYEIDSTEEWKKEKILSNLPEAIEVHSFKIIENEN